MFVSRPQWFRYRIQPLLCSPELINVFMNLLLFAETYPAPAHRNALAIWM